MKYGFKDVVIDYRTGLNPRKNFVLGSGENHYITIKDIYNGQINITDKTDRVDDNAIQIIKKRSRIKTGDILFVSIGRIGETAIVTAKDDTWDVNESVFVFTINSGIIIPEYFCMLLKSEAVQKYLLGNSSGSTFKSIKMNQLVKMIFDLPPLKLQEEIVSKLSKIKAIRDLRTTELKYLDGLIKARFIELFGDPYSNPRNWKQMTFKEASTRLSDGPFGSNLKSEHYSDTGVRVIRLGNIGVGTFIDDDKSFIPVEHYEKLKKYTCRSGEIVIGTLGDPNLRACIIPQDIGIAINKADCVHFIPKHDVLNVTFACQYINCPETLLLAQGMIHGQTRARISSGQIAEMPIFIPPMNLQNEFASFVSQVDKSKLSIQASLDQLETLKQSLMQKYYGI